MWTVVVALLPGVLGAGYFFGYRALGLIGLSIVAALVSEALTQRAFGRRVTIRDGSAVITGILLAFNLPPGVPFWIPVVGSAFAIVVVKQFFGGLGYNFLNPALAARAFLMAAWPSYMTGAFSAPRAGYLAGFDAVTQATPLSLLKQSTDLQILTKLNSGEVIRNLIFGFRGGCLGETSALLLGLGATLLLVRGIIDYRIPLAYLGTVGILTLVLPTPASPIFHLLAGGLILGAFFMATDYTTTPVTKLGRWIFGIGCGVLTVLIRLWGGYPEGVSYSILLMNLTTPLLDRFTQPKRFGK
jgi:electron transport complex protein RnfD